MESVSSAERDENGDPNLPDFKIERYAMEYYEEYTKKATNALTAFASSLTPQKPVVVTYFDEAHELKLSYWMLLRLLNNQDREIPMWAVFMGTHSSITYSSPAPRDGECSDSAWLTISYILYNIQCLLYDCARNSSVCWSHTSLLASIRTSYVKIDLW